MRKFRHIAIFLTLLAQTIIIVHNVIPHHHHHGGGAILCFGTECHEADHHNHLEDHELHFCDNDSESLCTRFFELFSQHYENIADDNLPYIIIEDIFLKGLQQVLFIDFSERCNSQYTNLSPLLRAPPVV